METIKHSRFGIVSLTASAMIAAACSGGGAQEQPSPDASVTTETAPAQEQDFVAGKKLYSEQLSQTARLEFWDQGKDGIMVSMSGHNQYDADKQQLLEKAVAAEGSASASRLYKHLNPKRADMPGAVLDIDRLLEARLAGRATEMPEMPSRPMEAAIIGDRDTVGELAPAGEPTALPLEGQGNLTWMAIWFRDTFCSYGGHDKSVCLLDRNPNPYVQQSSTGRHHIITANTDYQDIRFRGYSSDCQFWCGYEQRWNLHIVAGHWDQRHWLNTNLTTDRRGRIDAWDGTNKTGPLVQYAMTWQTAPSGSNTCKATGQTCSSSFDCCIVAGGAQCVQGVCKNDPTPNANCDWAGEFCCSGTATTQLYCNRTADPNLRCAAGTCVR